MHATRVPCLEQILGWKVFYRPHMALRYSTVPIDPFTHERGEAKDHESTVPTEFTFGLDAEWHIVLQWRDGDEAPPVWLRYEENLIRAVKHVTGELFLANAGKGSLLIDARSIAHQ
jgi:hypothetical protein